MNNQAYIEQKVKYLNVNYEYIEKKKILTYSCFSIPVYF